MGKASVDSNNSSIISSEYVSYADESSLMSVDPGLVSEPGVVDLSSPASCSADQYSAPLALPSHLSLETPVRVNRGGERTITLGRLLRDAATDRQAMAEVIQIAQARSATLADACYMVSDENPDQLMTVLAQLSSSDPVARREGAISLTQFLLNTRDQELQRGLLATVDEIRTPEAKQVLTDVYRRSEDRNVRQYLEHLPTHGLYLRNQAQVAAQNPGTPAAAFGNASNDGASLALALTGNGAGGAALNPSLPLFNPTALAQLSSAIESILQNPASKSLGLEPSQSVAIAQRLLEVGANTSAEQWVPTFRAVFMSAGWSHPEFTAGHFTELAGLAEEVARTAAVNLQQVSNYGSSAPLAVPVPIPSGFNGVEGLAIASHSETRGAPRELTVRGFLASLVEMAFQEHGEGPIPTQAPLSTLANAGMQGAMGSIALANGSSFGFSGSSGSSRPSYFVEGPTDAEGDAREGFGGQGSSHSGQEQGENRESNDGASTYA